MLKRTDYDDNRFAIISNETEIMFLLFGTTNGKDFKDDLPGILYDVSKWTAEPNLGGNYSAEDIYCKEEAMYHKTL